MLDTWEVLGRRRFTKKMAEGITTLSEGDRGSRIYTPDSFPRSCYLIMAPSPKLTEKREPEPSAWSTLFCDSPINLNLPI